MAKQRYTLDTNTIMNNPYILNEINNSTIIIPYIVLEELDKHKNDIDLGYKIRLFSRFMDDLSNNNYQMDNGNNIEFYGLGNFDSNDLAYLGGVTNDNAIIHIAKLTNSILVSHDILARIKARELANLDVTSFTQEIKEDKSDGFYKGYLEYYLEDEVIDTLYRDKFIDINYIDEINTYPHMFIVFKRNSGKSGDLIGKVNKDMKFIELINPLNNVYGISPKNIEQLITLHLLLDNDIPLVTLLGPAGTGKTLLSLASSLTLSENGEYENGITCAIPIVDMGKELGTLPGDKDEKLSPYLQSYYDALDFLYGGNESFNNALQSGQINIKMDALNYIRGRSIPHSLYIVDEAQNLSKHEIKTIATRMSKGSKLILMGDIEQIDVPYLDKYNNGLTHIVESFKNSGLHGHVTLTKTVRSLLANEAAKLL